MDDPRYSDAELANYFADPAARRRAADGAGNGSSTKGNGASGKGNGNGATRSAADAELERHFAAPRGPVPGPDDDLLAAFGPGAPSTRPAARGTTGRTGGDGAPGRPAAPAAPRYVPPPPPPDTPERRMRSRANRFFARVLYALVAFTLLVLLGLVWLSRDLPSLEEIENPRNQLATLVYSADGEEMARYYDEENRTWVPLDSISPHVVNALLSTEDRDFYRHWGVHLRRTLQAPFTLLTGRTQGGSTITQQLARNLYREQVGFDRSPTRKIKEILTAIRLERAYTKREILEFYLNTVPFRYNAYGIESAAQTYFQKPAAELDPAESATLVGMLAANTRYDPRSNPDASRERRDVVLSNMLHEGFLSQSDYSRFSADPIQLNFLAYSHENNMAPHFAEVLRLWFREWCEQYGYDPYADGLVIRTTIDSRVQRAAQAAVDSVMPGLQAVVDYEWATGGGFGSDPESYRRRMARGDITPFAQWWSRNRAIVDEYIAQSARFDVLEARGRSRADAIAELRDDEDYIDSLRTVHTRLESGLVAMDPRNGHVRAWVGGRDFAADKYDHVGQARRQPGSTFKLFVYTAAFDNGFSPSYPILDAPFAWEGWRPQNSGGGYSGYIAIRSALAASKNVVAARLTRELGVNEVRRYAESLGIRSRLCDNAPGGGCNTANAIGLGVYDVNLLEMAAAYSTVADGGVYHGPPRGRDPLTDSIGIAPHITLAIDRIEDRYGNVVAEFNSTGREVLSASTAWTMVDAMRGVITGGTARSFVPRFPSMRGFDLSGKTGTTQESADGWFMLMHPQLVVGSWVGFNDRRITFRSGYWGQGAHTAMLVTGGFLEALQAGPEATRLEQEARFEQPENYQPPSGRRARFGSDVTGDYFVRRRGGAAAEGGGDRPARDLLERWEGGTGGGNAPPATPPATPAPTDRGRVGW
ncbi:MAG TPA: transglycosylase domain-containing protein [Rhodothermales bacterium]|nr:transglycosylase domain-containing protein [Rhodothermales bacterium]